MDVAGDYHAMAEWNKYRQDDLSHTWDIERHNKGTSNAQEQKKIRQNWAYHGGGDEDEVGIVTELGVMRR